MQCVKCNQDTHVLQTRGIRRRRECLSCGFRFTTIEQLFMGSISGDTEAEPKPRKPKVEKAPRVNKAKAALVARKEARDAIEKRRWDREAEAWWEEDNNYLPDRW